MFVFEFVYKNISIIYIEMFYIITSRIPLISHDNTNRKYFKLFVLGSAIYAVVHYYLYKELRAGFIEKIKKFLYHVMVIDFIIASVLLKYLKIANPEEENEDVVTDKKQAPHQSNESEDRARNARLNAELEEQRRLFLEQHQQRMLEQRMLEQNRLRLLEQKRELDEKNQKAEKEKTEKSNKSDDKNKKEVKTEKKKSKVNSDKSSESSSSSSSESSSKKSGKSDKSTKSKEKDSETSESPKPKKSDKKKEKKEDNNTESELPLYQ